jgi:hypothetical protein
VYTPTRVLHGTRNATQHLQTVVVVMMDGIKSNIKVWLSDCLLHTKTEDDLLATLNFFFNQCREHGLKLHASKCVLFAPTVRFCGRLITKDGVRFDPKNMEALQTMQEPQSGADLVQYVAAVNWMRSAIPNYSKRVAPLQEVLAKVFEGKSRRLKKAAAAVSLLPLWGPEEKAAFKDLQAAIMDSMTLALNAKARWMLPVKNLNGENVGLEFFLVPRSGPLLLGNSLLHKAVVDRTDDHIEPTGARGLRVVIPTYFDGVRTRFSVFDLEVTFTNNSKLRGAFTR